MVGKTEDSAGLSDGGCLGDTRGLLDGLRAVWNAVLDFVLPAFCAVCERPLRGGESIVCEDCWYGFPECTDDGCPRCGSSLSPSGGRCLACAGSTFSFSGAAVLGVYEGVLETLIALMKYRPMPDLARRLGERLGCRLRSSDRVEGCQIVVPVPLHTTKARERGFSQTAILARQVAHALDLPCGESTLRRARWTRSQVKLTWDERRENVRGAFGSGRGPRPHGQKVLLVDDVLTSGATADAASVALLAMGAREVVVAAVARARLARSGGEGSQAPETLEGQYESDERKAGILPGNHSPRPEMQAQYETLLQPPARRGAGAGEYPLRPVRILPREVSMYIRWADDERLEPVNQDGAEKVSMAWLLDPTTGTPTFSMRLFRIEAGGCTPRHTHSWEHEVYVLSGSGRVWTGEGWQPVRKGSYLLVDPGEEHQFACSDEEEMRFLCLIPNPQPPPV